MLLLELYPGDGELPERMRSAVDMMTVTFKGIEYLWQNVHHRRGLSLSLASADDSVGTVPDAL